jgi:hypothetical protein
MSFEKFRKSVKPFQLIEIKFIISKLLTITLVRLLFIHNLTLSLVNFLASCTYLLPLSISLGYFNHYLRNIVILRQFKNVLKTIMAQINRKIVVTCSIFKRSIRIIERLYVESKNKKIVSNFTLNQSPKLNEDVNKRLLLIKFGLTEFQKVITQFNKKVSSNQLFNVFIKNLKRLIQNSVINGIILLGRVKQLIIGLISPKVHFGVPIKTKGFIDKFSNNIIITKLLRHRYLIAFILMYYTLIKFGRENKIPHVLRFHTIHALLICILQLPTIYIHEKLLKILTLNRIVSDSIKNLRLLIIISDLGLIFYSMYKAIMGYSINIPILTEACKKHVGEDYNN